MEDDSVGRVVEALEDDAFRRGGSITYDRLLAIASKNNLSAEAIVVVKQRLAARDVEIEGANQGESDTDSIRISDSVEAAGGSADDEEPPAEAIAEVRDILTAFYQDASKFKLLSASEEISLARRIHAGQDARTRLTQDASNEFTRELQRLADDGTAARNMLIEANLRLVPYVAKQVRSHGSLTQEDLIQEGNLGLLRAADRFDSTHETRFSTYAVWWIWSFMKRAVDDRGRLVRIPVHILDRVPMLLRTQRSLSLQNGGRKVSVQDLAEHLSWRVDTVQFVLQAMETPPASIDGGDEEGLHLGERLAAPLESSPEIATARQEQRGIIEAWVASLGGKLAFVVRERFGLSNGIPRTLEDIGAQLGVTRERIRQIEVKAFEKLRHPSRMKHVRELLALDHVAANASEPREDQGRNLGKELQEDPDGAQ